MFSVLLYRCAELALGSWGPFLLGSVSLCFFLSPCPLFPALGRSAELLGLDSAQLTDALTQRSMFLRGEEILTPLTIQQVRALGLQSVF